MKNLILVILSVFLLVSCSKNASAQKTEVKAEVVSVENFEKEFNPEQHQLLDVRTPEEYTEGKIEGAVNINVLDEENFKQEIQGLDKEKPIYVYCRSGKRSAKASKILKENGFKDVRDIDGGINAWNDSHKRIEDYR